MAFPVKELTVPVCTECWNDRFDIHCYTCRPNPGSLRRSNHYKILYIATNTLVGVNISLIKKEYESKLRNG